MIQKRHKLRLRKQVIVAIPIALLITSIITLVITNSSKTFSNEVAYSSLNENAVVNEAEDNYTNKYLDNLNKELEKRQKDNTVIYYANQFKLNVNKTLELVHQYTNNYTAEDYKQNFVIGPDFIKNREGSFSSEEAGIAYFVKDLYSWPQNYGLQINEIRTSEVSDTSRNIVDGKIYLDNGLTYQQYMGKLADMYGIDKSFALAVSYHETGNLTSGLFTQSNNCGGQRSYYGWMNFTTLEAGMLSHILSIRSIAKQYNLDMSNIDSINQFSSVYVKGRYGDVAYEWVNRVTATMQSINQDLFVIE